MHISVARLNVMLAVLLGLLAVYLAVDRHLWPVPTARIAAPAARPQVPQAATTSAQPGR